MLWDITPLSYLINRLNPGLNMKGYIFMERLITERQEQALKLCHHDLGGLTQTEAAEEMDISQPALSELLTAVRKVLPQYFPILTKLEMKCYHYYMVEGWPVGDIVQYMNKPACAIYDALQRVRTKGKYFPEAKRKILSYDPSMDINVKQRF